MLKYNGKIINELVWGHGYTRGNGEDEDQIVSGPFTINRVKAKRYALIHTGTGYNCGEYLVLRTCKRLASILSHELKWDFEFLPVEHAARLEEVREIKEFRKYK